MRFIYIYEKEEAQLEIIKRYFSNYGPATLKDASYFLGTTQANVKDWLEKLPVNNVECEGKTYHYIENGKRYDKDVPDCIFLAGFDQLILGYHKQ